MAFFKGQETYSIDNKGRVNIPAKMRKSMAPEAKDTFVVTKGSDECIIAFPLDEWKKYEEKLQNLNQFESKNRFFMRSFLMWSEEVSLDSQQRISIPRKLLEDAGIESKITIVGMGDKIEFWNPDKFNEYLKSSNESYELISEQVMRS